ncbi:MAG: TIGR04076 family protein [Candidatus Bathyarchaeota archaeon]|nr:TIGR04076 family protein [Candidatus Bathyarchaeota archaeon]
MNLAMRDVKITVIEKLSNGNSAKRYAVRGYSAICDSVEVGMEFISKGMAMPPNFCSWAWADIQRDVANIAMGGNIPWMKEKGTMITCCTDGLRPVVFKLERV